MVESDTCKHCFLIEGKQTEQQGNISPGWFEAKVCLGLQQNGICFVSMLSNSGDI